jgi:hypothetical protein
MTDSTRFVVKVKRMESPFERGYREKQTEHVPVALAGERISGESAQRCDDGPGRLEMHNDLEMDLVRPLDGDNDQNVLSAFTDDDLLDNDIALAMIMAPQHLTDANGKSRTRVDINQVAAKAVQAVADDSDDDRTRQVVSFDRIHARIEKNSIGLQKKHGSGSDGVCMVEESPYLDETDVQEESASKDNALLHYDLHEEMTSFDQSDVELATDYQPQAECGSTINDSDDQMREEPFRVSPTVQTLDKPSNKNSWSERRGEDDVSSEEESLLTARKSITSVSEKGESVPEPPHQKKSKPKAKKRKVSEDSTLSKQEKILKSKRKKERCQAEDEMTNKDTKQNEKKKRKKERTASYRHLVVPIGTDVINVNSNVHDNVSAHEDVVEEHTVAATELVEEGSITDKDGNATSFAEMPALHRHPSVNSERKHNQAYESKHDEKWNKFFMELVEYKQKNGHCNCTIKKNGTLGRWIARQRTLFKSKKLKEDRYEKLVGIGFVFEDTRFAFDNKKWNRHFMELVEYKEKNGHCNFPTANGSFGKWISNQRTLFKSKELKEDRYEKLVGIGFASDNDRWDTRFMELVEYNEKNGNSNVPQRNGSLGRWVKTQRTLFRSKELKEDRYEKLVGIGFA